MIRRQTQRQTDEAVLLLLLPLLDDVDPVAQEQ